MEGWNNFYTFSFNLVNIVKYQKIKSSITILTYPGLKIIKYCHYCLGYIYIFKGYITLKKKNDTIKPLPQTFWLFLYPETTTINTSMFPVE